MELNSLLHTWILSERNNENWTCNPTHNSDTYNISRHSSLISYSFIIFKLVILQVKVVSHKKRIFFVKLVSTEYFAIK